MVSRAKPNNKFSPSRDKLGIFDEGEEIFFLKDFGSSDLWSESFTSDR
jgi:hypothetical protein